MERKVAITYNVLALGVVSNFEKTDVQLKTNDNMKNKSLIYHRIGNYAKRVLAAVVHFFKVRWFAKPFDIWKECQDDNRKKDAWLMSDYISYDGKLYYGHPLGIFFESSQNSWWLSRNSR